MPMSCILLGSAPVQSTQISSAAAVTQDQALQGPTETVQQYWTVQAKVTLAGPPGPGRMHGMTCIHAMGGEPTFTMLQTGLSQIVAKVLALAKVRGMRSLGQPLSTLSA